MHYSLTSYSSNGMISPCPGKSLSVVVSAAGVAVKKYPILVNPSSMKSWPKISSCRKVLETYVPEWSG